MKHVVLYVGHLYKLFWTILSSANFKKDPPWYIFCLSVHAPATSVLKVILKFLVAMQCRQCLVYCNRDEDRSRNDGRNHSPESVWFVLMGMFGGGQWSDTDGGYIITLPPSLRTEESSLLYIFQHFAIYSIWARWECLIQQPFDKSNTNRELVWSINMSF